MTATNTLSSSLLAQFDISDDFYKDNYARSPDDRPQHSATNHQDHCTQILSEAIMFLKTAVWILMFVISILSLAILRLASPAMASGLL